MKSVPKKYTIIQKWTEQQLTKRRAKKRKAQEKAKKKGAVREWIEALLWAVAVVFLINQFLFQLYEIPTPSMEDTLLVKDRVFVNKIIYGPEIYPGGPKILDFRIPMRNEIIVFENPNYISRGPLFDITTRIVYMITLSLVNLDKDENGEPRSQLYVKRAVGMPGDRIAFDKGNVMIQPEGFAEALTESEFRTASGYDFPLKRQIQTEDYSAYNYIAVRQAYSGFSIDTPQYLTDIYSPASTRFIDYYHVYKQIAYTQTGIDPSDSKSRSLYARYSNGFHIPEGYALPLGDNRDNSTDGRYFGPVKFENILGKTVFKFWPLARIGIAR